MENDTPSSIAASSSVEYRSGPLAESPREKSVLASQEFRLLFLGSVAVLCLALWLVVKLGRTDSELLMLDFRKWQPLSTRLDEPAARAFYESIQGAAPELRAFRIVLQLPPGAVAGERFGAMKRFPSCEEARLFRFLIRKNQNAPANTSSIATEEVRVVVNGMPQASYQLRALERGELVEVELPPGETEVEIELIASPSGDARPNSAESLYIEFGKIEGVQP